MVQHDLDNYLLPLTIRLSSRTRLPFVSVWGTKQHADTSTVCVARAVPVEVLAGRDHWYEVRTSASWVTAAYKQQIQDQLAAAEALPEGAVSMHVSFTVGPNRNWTNLWKPTIDAFGTLLGSTTPERSWNPRDGRITELGLHVRMDPSLGHPVNIAIHARPAPFE